MKRLESFFFLKKKWGKRSFFDKILERKLRYEEYVNDHFQNKKKKKIRLNFVFISVEMKLSSAHVNQWENIVEKYDAKIVKIVFYLLFLGFYLFLELKHINLHNGNFWFFCGQKLEKWFFLCRFFE